MKEIHYTILSLRFNEIDEVVEQLEDDNRIKEWLESNKNLYGNSFDDWKPFNKTIKNFIQSNGVPGIIFCPEVRFMETDNHESKMGDIAQARVNVIFIDPLTIFLDKYRDLILEISANIFEGGKRIGCFIIPSEINNCLNKKCFEQWKNIKDYIAYHHLILDESQFIQFFKKANLLPCSQPRMAINNNNLLSSDFQTVPNLINNDNSI
jgi:hypothetical protein